ncbi:UNVERIFIED_CONTAM: hypothetical protein Sradi_7065400 [Sesamum radiatum]|uniref:DUF4283 domain-containing protein n=1 Tax=Sesamum radiatum TaxID=300843 RepID=A0AAW2J5M3_SESRA
MAALTELKERWQAKFGDVQESRLRPVSTYVATPFRTQPVRVARRIPRVPPPEQQRAILNSQGRAEMDGDCPSKAPIDVEPRVIGQPPTGVVEGASGPSAPKGKLDGPTVLGEAPNSLGSQDPIFVGNIKLNTGPVDVVADAFLNSTRKTLRYIAPIKQRNEIVIRPTTSMVEQGSKRWLSTAVDYFLGKKPYFPHLEAFVRSNLRGLESVSANSNGFYFFRFKTVIYMEEVIEGGPWLFQGQPIVLQSWEQGMTLRRRKHTRVPVWIRLKHLPVEYWTDDGLSAVASGVGTPLYTDSITKRCSRLDFARVCVLVDYNAELPKHLVVISPVIRDGKETPMRIEVEYEWLPQSCDFCCALGHSAVSCPEKRRRGSSVPISVFVKKKQSMPVDYAGSKDEVAIRNAEVEDEVGAEVEGTTQIHGPDTNHVASLHTTNSQGIQVPRSRVLNAVEDGGSDRVSKKGKEIVIFNPFEALNGIGDDMGNQYGECSSISGPNVCSPQSNLHD